MKFGDFLSNFVWMLCALHAYMIYQNFNVIFGDFA